MQAKANFVSAKETGHAHAPTVVTAGEHSTPVWLQQRWNSGQYREFIQRNGCGHCCAAMALRLHGIDMDPHQEYETCRSLWGAPDESENKRQGHYMSISGIVKILERFGVRATCFGMDHGQEGKAKRHISAALSNGKQVIFWSHPSNRLHDNPFSCGEHYVLAVGYANDRGDILLANSNESKAPDGVQISDMDTIIGALYLGSRPCDKTWGDDDFAGCAGYAIIG